MIDEILFKKIIKEHKLQNERLQVLESYGFNIWDTPVLNFGFIMFDRLIETNFDEEGRDWINWWLYERDLLGNKPQAWDENGNVIPTETVDDLWNLVEKHKI